MNFLDITLYQYSMAIGLFISTFWFAIFESDTEDWRLITIAKSMLPFVIIYGIYLSYQSIKIFLGYIFWIFMGYLS